MFRVAFTVNGPDHHDFAQVLKHLVSSFEDVWHALLLAPCIVIRRMLLPCSCGELLLSNADKLALSAEDGWPKSLHVTNGIGSKLPAHVRLKDELEALLDRLPITEALKHILIDLWL